MFNLNRRALTNNVSLSMIIHFAFAVSFRLCSASAIWKQCCYGNTHTVWPVAALIGVNDNNTPSTIVTFCVCTGLVGASSAFSWLITACCIFVSPPLLWTRRMKYTSFVISNWLDIVSLRRLASLPRTMPANSKPFCFGVKWYEVNHRPGRKHAAFMCHCRPHRRCHTCALWAG